MCTNVDPCQIANDLNTHFAIVGAKLDNKIPSQTLSPSTKTYNHDNFVFAPVSLDEAQQTQNVLITFRKHYGKYHYRIKMYGVRNVFKKLSYGIHEYHFNVL